MIERPLDNEVEKLKSDKLDKTGTAEDSDKLGGQNASYYKTTVMTAKGHVFNSAVSTITGHGVVTVFFLPVGIAKLVFSIQITTAASSDETNVFDFGLNRDLLTNTFGMPRITPMEGGVCRFYRDGVIESGLTEYGGTFLVYNQFWKFSRMYNTDGYAGAWPSSMYAVGDRIEGVCYGTY